MDELFSLGDTNGNLTNAKDDPGDQVLIDVVPIPSENQTTDNADTFDPLAGIFG